MPTIDPDKEAGMSNYRSRVPPVDRLHVVVGILVNEDQQLFIQQRRPDTPKAGHWEFPGGKVESGEPAEMALKRELNEELGIGVVALKPLTVVTHDYEHAKVWLDVYQVETWQGIARGREGQKIAWVSPESVADFDILPAVPPILKAYLGSIRN